ncbi:hypothetical protein HELRODRAFT_63316 [Helobdella robusta]|uniref:NADP-dependent oxidoreductase domain-containing protein n=1 Tax=Helobdella robusta TaxID=6412 RepID=T1FXE2_HELRO|nr:hypothetical protein HELRODRAFT_63316 [Helobdella robusta]ESO12199.1 hypothetical protein HELRODRAFT_63316 [Helobdella robusta]
MKCFDQVLLNSGFTMPMISLGTFKLKGDDVFQIIDAALNYGYRSFDTAQVYKNEESIGNALKILLPKYNLNRKDIFLITKLGPKNHGNVRCRVFYLQSLRNLQTDYLDLFLIHWPAVQGCKPSDEINIKLRNESWQEMEKLVIEGKINSVGVSNYTMRHLEELYKYCKIEPSVLQIEYHPHLVQSKLLQFCQKNNLHLQAYSSLGSQGNNLLLSNNLVRQIALKHAVTNAQVLLKWAAQQNIGVIPKSTNLEHLAENLKIFHFQLTEKDIDDLNSLDKSCHYCWNPECVI